MGEYGTACPGCRRILHVKIELEPEPERATEPPEQRTRPEITAGAILGGIVSLESLIEHSDDPHHIDPKWLENRAQDGIDALVRVRDEAKAGAAQNEAGAQLVEILGEIGHQAEPDKQAGDKMGACPYRNCTEARELASRLRGGFPEPRVQVVGAECGCSIRKGPPWELEPCDAHQTLDPSQDPRVTALRSFIPNMPADATLLGAIRVMIEHIGGTTGASTIEWDPDMAEGGPPGPSPAKAAGISSADLDPDPARPGMTASEAFRAGAIVARQAVLDIECTASEATGVVRRAREAIGAELDERADRAGTS